MMNSGLKKHVDKLLFALAITVLATALFHFGTAKTSAGAKTTNIVFTQWWDNYLEKDTLNELVSEFEKTRPGIKIEQNPVSYEKLHGELFNKNDSPVRGDIIALDPLWVPELQKMEIIDFPDGQNLKAPILSFINVFYYNIGILREAGFSRPPKSRGELINYARALSSAEKGPRALAWGRNCSRGIYDDVLPWLWAGGAELTKDGKPVFNSRPVIDSLSFLASLVREGFIVPDGAVLDSEKKLEDFISGKAAFMISSTKDIEYVRKKMGDDAFGITSIPVPDNYSGKTCHASAGWTLGINARSANKEAARLFADFIAGKAALLSEKARVIPGNNRPDPFYSKVWDITIAGENAQDLAGLPWGKLAEIFNEELSSLFAGQHSAAETAAAIQKRWEK